MQANIQPAQFPSVRQKPIFKTPYAWNTQEGQTEAELEEYNKMQYQLSKGLSAYLEYQDYKDTIDSTKTKETIFNRGFRKACTARQGAKLLERSLIIGLAKEALA